MQPAAHACLGARARVRSRCAGGCQRTRAWRDAGVARRGDRGARRLGGPRRDRPHALRPRPDPGHRLPPPNQKPPGPAPPPGRRGPRGSLPSDLDAHLAELAHHFFEAAAGGDGQKAVDYARRAGSRAVALLAYEEAVRLYDMAIEALGPDAAQPPGSAASCSCPSATLRAGRGRPGGQGDLPARGRARQGAGLPEMLARAAAGYGGRFLWAHARPTSGSSRCSRRRSPLWARSTTCCASSCSRGSPRRSATHLPASVASASVKTRSRWRAGSATPQRSPTPSPRRQPP